MLDTSWAGGWVRQLADAHRIEFGLPERPGHRRRRNAVRGRRRAGRRHRRQHARGDSVFEISADGTTLLAENTNVPGAMGVALFGGHVYVTEYGNVTDNGDSTTSMPIEELNEPDLCRCKR